MHKPSPFWTQLTSKKKGFFPRIAFCDATDPRILKAVELINQKKLFQPVLIGSESDVLSIAKKHRLRRITSKNIYPSLTDQERETMKASLQQKQSKYNIANEELDLQLRDSLYVGLQLLDEGKIDGIVAGALRPTADVVKASIRLLGPKAGTKMIAGHFLLESDHRSTADKTPFLFADCAVIPEPSSLALAIVAKGAADAYSFFTGKKPRVAFLSFSTRDSAQHPLVDRIKEAKTIFVKHNPDICVDGEIQADAALDLKVAQIKKAGDSPLEGQANVFIFPTLEAGNIGYKLIQRFAKTRIAGPILWGLKKPVSDLSRGCTVQEVVDSALCLSKMLERLN